MKTITVVAIATGFDNLVVRNAGDKFEVPVATARKHSSWFKPVDEKFIVDPPRVVTPAGEVGGELAALKAQVAQLTALLTRPAQVETKPKADADSLV